MKTWTKQHEIALVREVLAVNPFMYPKGTTERAKLWEEVAINLNVCQEPKFDSLTLRSVRDHVNLVLIKKYKKKIAEEERSSGIEVGEPSELDKALEMICENSEESDRNKEASSNEKRQKLEKEQKQMEEIRAKALEKVGETKKRIALDDEEEEDTIPKTKRRARRNGKETVAYLQERNDKEMIIRREEVELKKRQLDFQENQQNQQQQQQKAMLDAFQQQQQQQLLVLTQMQQQNTQALLQVVQELAKNKQ